MQQPGEFAIGANKDELVQINNLSGLTASQLMARISHDTSTLATNIRLVKGVRYYFDIKNESNTVIPYVIFVN